MNEILHSEGLGFARLMMVLSSLSPLFILWGVRGVKCIEDRWLWLGLAFLVLAPNIVLYLRFRSARLHNDAKTVTIGQAEDHRDNLLVYLFAMLIPLYDANLGNQRETAAVIVAFVFVLFLFWHLNLHYMNVAFALFGYRVFTIQPPTGNALTEGFPFVLLTVRTRLNEGQQIRAYRISNTVFFEPKGTV